MAGGFVRIQHLARKRLPAGSSSVCEIAISAGSVASTSSDCPPSFASEAPPRITGCTPSACTTASQPASASADSKERFSRPLATCFDKREQQDRDYPVHFLPPEHRLSVWRGAAGLHRPQCSTPSLPSIVRFPRGLFPRPFSQHSTPAVPPARMSVAAADAIEELLRPELACCAPKVADTSRPTEETTIHRCRR